MKQYHRESNNCLQDIVGMILLNYGYNPMLMYQGCLNFGYNREKVKIGERIAPSRDGNWLDNCLFESVYENYGVLFTKERGEMDSIKKHIQFNRGLILEIDIFDCNWHKLAGKYHSPHYCWVIDFNERYLLCALPYGNKYGYLELDRLKKNTVTTFYKYETVECFKNRGLEEVLKKTWHKCNTSFCGQTDIQRLKQMSIDLGGGEINLENEYKGIKDIYAIPLVRAFERVLWSRINFRDLIFYLDDEKKGSKLICILQNCINLWDCIKNYFIRDIIRGQKVIRSNIRSCVDKVVNEEIAILDEIENIIS